MALQGELKGPTPIALQALAAKAYAWLPRFEITTGEVAPVVTLSVTPARLVTTV